MALVLWRDEAHVDAHAGVPSPGVYMSSCAHHAEGLLRDCRIRAGLGKGFQHDQVDGVVTGIAGTNW